jgi:hypothetical protein
VTWVDRQRWVDRVRDDWAEMLMGTQSGAMRTRISALIAAGAAAALALCGCGSGGSSTHTTAASAAQAVVRAADVTGAADGYRFHGTVAITGPAAIKDTMSGTVLRAANRGQIELHQHLLGRSMTLQERFSGRTFWISAAGIPHAAKLTSKPWLKYEIDSTLNQLGVGGLPSGGSDPGQFLTYLKGVGGDARRLGSQRIGGVPTTHYRATVNLDRYVRTVPAAQRAQARKAIARLVSTLGSDKLRMQVWIDDHNLTRRIEASFPECVDQQHLNLSVSVDMYDFGTRASVTLPSASQSYDITPLVDRQLAHQKLGCATPS